MIGRIRIIPHEAVPLCGSYEVRFPDGRPSRYFYWDDIAGRRLRPDLVHGATAKRDAKSFARAEQDALIPSSEAPTCGRTSTGIGQRSAGWAIADQIS
jgi:hypothetical protein